MREILFRGKKHDGTWAYGSLIQAGTYCCILEAEENVHPKDYPYLDDDIGTFDGKATPVNPETVGQYVGVVDANGVMIFEGDIVELYCGMYGTYVMTMFDIRALYYPIESDKIKEVTIIGNIYDNPEMSVSNDTFRIC